MSAEAVKLETSPVLSLDNVAGVLNDDAVAILSVFSVQIETWLVLQRRHFDVHVRQEPFRAVEVLLQPDTGHFIKRVFGRSLEYGIVNTAEDLKSVLIDAFDHRTLPCLGHHDLEHVDVYAADGEFQVVSHPFQRAVSVGCPGLYKSDLLTEKEQLGIGLCGSCNRPPQQQQQQQPQQQQQQPQQPSTSTFIEPKVELKPALKKMPMKKIRIRRKVRPEVIEKKVDDEGNEELKCPAEECDFWAPNRAALRRHRQSKHFLGPFNCTICGPRASCNYLPDLQQHYLDHHAEQPIPCPLCQKTFPLEQPLLFKQHYLECLETVEKEKRKERCAVLICPHEGCSYSATANTIRRHRQLEHYYGPFSCTLCGPDFTCEYVDALYSHFFVHHGDQMFPCPVCKREFAGDILEEFKAHYRECRVSQTRAMERQKYYQAKSRGYVAPRAPSEKRFTCDLCGKSYMHKIHLQQHKYAHAGVKPYKCSYPDCDFATHNRSTVNIHERGHRKREQGIEKEGRVTLVHKCDKCDRQFYIKSSLDAHIRKVHEGIVDKYPCPKCGKILLTLNSMRRHMRTFHSEQKIYCETCNAEFGAEAQLRLHMRVHKEPKYMCRYCGKKFRYSGSFKDHERLHTGETPYACKWCDYRCKSSSVLNKHNLAKHKELLALQ